MIISNATPLIAFARIGRLDLLQTVVGRLVIPTAIEQEISDYTHDKPGAINLSEQQGIRFSPQFIAQVLKSVDE